MKPHTPKYFVIQLGALIALYVSVTSLLILLFSVYNLKFPDAASFPYEGDAARQSIRFALAMLVVFFPTYIGLTRVSNQQRRKETEGQYTLLARWLVYISLLVGGGVLLGDLVTLIVYFLNGEITTRFLFKVFTLFVVVGAAFHYYILDIRGYFNKRVDKALYFALGAVVVVLASVGYGYTYIEAPAEVREMRIDDRQIQDLQGMQYQVEEYYRVEGVLPTSIPEMYKGLPVPEAPEGRDDYLYNPIDETTYELCATFHSASTGNERFAVPVIEKNYNWNHNEAEWCFERAVTNVDKEMIQR